jgi:hypothetical protein
VSIAPYAKAVAAFISTAASGLLAALLLGSPGGATIAVSEIIMIASTTIVATLGVFFAPANKPATDPA